MNDYVFLMVLLMPMMNLIDVDALLDEDEVQVVQDEDVEDDVGVIGGEVDEIMSVDNGEGENPLTMKMVMMTMTIVMIMLAMEMMMGRAVEMMKLIVMFMKKGLILV
ncbi:hypothetical protein O6P43_013120 [Quillaja saponaria]|uniref:Uncharacterized protein n=1 Tax=Quillaja saponaria TaxID=32244 RepID=A0AAD7M391_QUISA|nr:hypothetical protein O6P43_013120 [Quillaja saponaria]